MRVSAASNMTATPTMSPGARVCNEPRLASSKAAKAMITVRAEEAMTLPIAEEACRSAWSCGSPACRRSRYRNSEKTM